MILHSLQFMFECYINTCSKIFVRWLVFSPVTRVPECHFITQIQNYYLIPSYFEKWHNLRLTNFTLWYTANSSTWKFLLLLKKISWSYSWEKVLANIWSVLVRFLHTYVMYSIVAIPMLTKSPFWPGTWREWGKLIRLVVTGIKGSTSGDSTIFATIVDLELCYLSRQCRHHNTVHIATVNSIGSN